ncbi:uncharacterized protein THITE_2144733 [Thermothielavioides terrestris NRRL 8126]|uniref:NAD-dependent epimerase/dehydratase domain-containing protein n=1 Tax=Thermothielavioides terrestris (strain ATCC 38088 / NRRL 8126) TaxID=578455 RepID=G2R159_THETT|nr:uncharacterized protein THITE_2144733 [Thermothielavioides terrestris NRRL 8126]AEO67349.1 hypothetical protein THITE_2144733 [Thermothielavioides terrestris NRRL 8126]
MAATGSAPSPSKGKVLLTGGTGFIASHVLDCLLDHGFDVVVTVVKSDPPFDYVVHTASPYQLHWDDPVRDCLDPAIKGTTGILRSIHAYAPNVKRVVITSSSAAILRPPNHPPVYDESSWSDVTWEQALDPAHTYRASKKFAEQAAWDFLSSTTPPPSFTLATINNSYTFGPIPRSLDSLDALNTSNHRIRDLVLGRWRRQQSSTSTTTTSGSVSGSDGGGIPPTSPVFTFVDVRDVALAHVRALTVPAAGSKRFYVVGGYFSNAQIVGVVRKRFPALRDRLPGEDEEAAAEDFPRDHWRFDNARSREVLGLEYRGLEESVVDTVRSILAFQGAKEYTRRRS